MQIMDRKPVAPTLGQHASMRMALLAADHAEAEARLVELDEEAERCRRIAEERLGDIARRRVEAEIELRRLQGEVEACRRLVETFGTVSVDASAELRGGGSLRRQIAILLRDGTKAVGDIPQLLRDRFGRDVGKDDVWPVLSRMKSEGALRSAGRGRWALRRAVTPSDGAYRDRTAGTGR